MKTVARRPGRACRESRDTTEVARGDRRSSLRPSLRSSPQHHVPSYSLRRGNRYRYYIRSALLRDHKERVGSLGRVNADDVEAGRQSPGRQLSRPELSTREVAGSWTGCATSFGMPGGTRRLIAITSPSCGSVLSNSDA
jgi:hypothetical protein